MVLNARSSRQPYDERVRFFGIKNTTLKYDEESYAQASERKKQK